MSLAELTDHLESYERRERDRVKQELSHKHFLAQDIAQYVNRMLNGSKDGSELMELWDFYPELFREEKSWADQIIRNQKLEVYRAQMQDFVYRHNHQRTGGEKS